MGVTKKHQNVTVGNLVEMAQNNELSFTMAIQRNYVWKPDQASLLVHSLLENFPVPALFGWDSGTEEVDSILMMDGKQRSTTLMHYMEDRFALVGDKVTPIVYTDKKESEEPITFDPKGKRFSELPKKLQDKVRNYGLTLYTFKKDTGETRSVEELQEEIFLRLNSGSALTRMEIIRSQAGTTVMEFINEISAMPFFKSSMALSSTDKLRFVDDQTVFQILLLLENKGEATAIGTKEIDLYRAMIRLQSIQPQTQELLRKLTAYMGEAFPVHEKWLKKVHVPILFLMANKALDMDTPIPATKFGGWAQRFFKLYAENKHHIQKQYEAGCTGGTAKSERVERRINFMTHDFDRNVFDAPDYVIVVKPDAPVTVSVTGKKRGRKSNAQRAAEAEVAAATAQVAATLDTDLSAAANGADSAEGTVLVQVVGTSDDQPQEQNDQAQG